MSDITQAHKTLVARLLEGDGWASPAQRRAAFDNAGLAEPLCTLIDKVVKHAYTVTDEDIASAKAAGLAKTTYSSSRCVPRSARPRGSTTRAAALEAATERRACASQSSIAATVSR